MRRLLIRLSRPGRIVGPSVSCGIAGGVGNDTVDTLFERAGGALHAAKRQGRNRIVVRIGGAKIGRG